MTPNPAVPAAPSSGGTLRSAFTYDLLGRQLTQNDYDAAGTSVVYARSAVYDAAGKLTSDSTTTVRWDGTYVTSNTYNYVSGGEYLLGALEGISTSNSKNGAWLNSTSMSNYYEWWNGAQQSSIAYTQSGGPSFTTTLFYDGVGTIAFAYIGDGRPRRVYYRTNTDGQVIHRGETDNLSSGDPHETWYRFGGREWGYVSNNGTWKLNEAMSVGERTSSGGSTIGAPYSEFSQGYDPINSYSQGGAAGTVSPSFVYSFVIRGRVKLSRFLNENR